MTDEQMKQFKELAEQMAKDRKEPCPHCGYCPHCGRRNHDVMPWYPAPYWPQPYPYEPYRWTYTTAGTSNAIWLNGSANA